MNFLKLFYWCSLAIFYIFYNLFRTKQNQNTPSVLSRCSYIDLITRSQAPGPTSLKHYFFFFKFDSFSMILFLFSISSLLSLFNLIAVLSHNYLVFIQSVSVFWKNFFQADVGKCLRLWLLNCYWLVSIFNNLIVINNDVITKLPHTKCGRWIIKHISTILQILQYY